MPYAKKMFGLVHKYHRNVKYTYCGKKLKGMNTSAGAGNPKKRCPACWGA